MKKYQSQLKLFLLYINKAKEKIDLIKSFKRTILGHFNISISNKSKYWGSWNSTLGNNKPR